ncbi:MAG: type IV pilin, partial [Candidatus Natronoplasma sp.]
MKNQARKMKKGIKSIRKRTHSRDRPDDEEGISEVVGSILTLTITVVIFTSVFASVTQLEGPEEQPHVDFSTEYEYTAQADYINITHEGGKNLDLDDHSFIVVVDDTGGEDSRSYSIDDDEMTTTGDESSFIIGDEICIKIEDELDISPDSRMELMVRQDSNSQIIYRTILLEEDRELLDIRNARIEYKFIWREHAEPGEEISIKAEVLAPIYLRQDDFRPEELNVTASTLQDGILYHEEKEEEVKEVELEHYHKGEFRSENISVVDDVDHTSYSVKINAVHEAEGLEATPEYISLHVGKPAVRRYQADLVIGNIDYEPGSPSHNEEFRVKIQIFNRGAQNYTADWKLKDNDVLKHEDTTTFIKGPDPTVVTAEYDIMGVDYHKIEVSVNTSFEDEDGSTVEDANPENNRKTFDVYVDPNMLIVKDMTADDDHEDGLMENALTDLDFDYGVHSVESEDEYPESDHLNQYSICIWVTGSGTDDEDIAPLPPSAQDELIKFIEEDNGRLWLLGSNLNEVDFQNDFRALLGISSGIGDTDETTLHGELENPEDDEDGTYGDHTYPVYSDTTAHELSLKSGVEDENTLDQGNNEIVGVGYDSDTDENKRTALNSFLFESVSHPAARGNMAQEVIKWLSNLTVRTGTDVSVSSQMIEPTAPMFMDNVTINATLRNNGAEDVNVTVRALRNQGEEVLEPVLDEPWLHIPGRGGTANVEFFWEADELGTHEFLVVADYYNELDENTRENNDITYKNLEITEDVVEVNVQYSTLVVDADVSEDTNVDYENVTKHVTDSLDRLGQERGETYDYYYVEDPANDNGPTASYMRNYNAIIWVTGERGSDVGQDIVFTEEDAERLLDYFEVEERGNVIFIGENILSYLYDN